MTENAWRPQEPYPTLGLLGLGLRASLIPAPNFQIPPS